MFDEDANLAGLFRRFYRCPDADWRGKCEGHGMQCRSAIEYAKLLVLAPDRWTKMLVRRQDHDLEITVAVAREGVGASESRSNTSASNRRHGEAQRSTRRAGAAARLRQQFRGAVARAGDRRLGFHDAAGK